MGSFTHPRHQLKRYNKRQHRQRHRILGCRSIHDRLAVIGARECYPYWEIDAVIGKRGTDAIVTLLKRKSRFYLVKKVTSKQADSVFKLLDMLPSFKLWCTKLRPTTI